ncbi:MULTISPECIES: hypothetical protein [Rhodopseudomonas]|uniref:Signal peptide protein n=1 Tax=Rhodopseudomonas palustris TaxID=1076 RepID=A0A0D7EQ29_RHOPL|nr:MULTISPECIES: hypothetical protein [Rhodopseudomonas]KIZ42924.1 signal peptide protein [Rhodopseudomonas palustris]MDF3810650.1 hypothetical protein [Rhodopseudomonas sp. BAL398]WOK18443.1 hypothetical protein RBJ75_02615 [Rhodopseudomonas sp. BAL398]
MLTRATTLALVALTLGGCGGGLMSSADDRGGSGQPFPSQYRSQIVAFLHTYLTNPVGVRDATMAEPVQRSVDGRQLYISCLRFTPRRSNGSYGPARELAVVHVDARVDRVMEEAGEACAGLTYAPFPELEKMSR